jgi:hypothetical protein
LTCRDSPGARVIRLGAQISFVQSLTIDIYRAISDFNFIPGQSYHALDIFLLRGERRMENNNIPPLRCPEAVT